MQFDSVANMFRIWLQEIRYQHYYDLVKSQFYLIPTVNTLYISLERYKTHGLKQSNDMNTCMRLFM